MNPSVSRLLAQRAFLMFGFGCTLVVLLVRVGGGIFSKAALAASQPHEAHDIVLDHANERRRRNSSIYHEPIGVRRPLPLNLDT